MICIVIILLFFMVAPFIDNWYEESEQEKNVDALAKAKPKKRRKYTWPSPGTGKHAGK